MKQFCILYLIVRKSGHGQPMKQTRRLFCTYISGVARCQSQHKYHIWRMNWVFEANCTGKWVWQLSINFCVVHDAMNGCKNLKFIKGLLWKCEYTNLNPSQWSLTGRSFGSKPQAFGFVFFFLLVFLILKQFRRISVLIADCKSLLWTSIITYTARLEILLLAWVFIYIDAMHMHRLVWACAARPKSRGSS